MAKHEVVDQIVESRQAVRVYNKESRCAAFFAHPVPAADAMQSGG